MYSEWGQFFGNAYPAMTIGYITELGLPEIKIEIKIWAAKPYLVCTSFIPWKCLRS